MDKQRTASFLASFLRAETPELQKIRQEALQDGVPVVRPETAALLSFFVKKQRPMRILEVGAAIGYSAVLMASQMPEEGSLVTIENYEPRIPAALRNIEDAGLSGKITLIRGDAGEVLKTLTGSFDLIFMDAAKAQYIHWLPDVLRLMSPDGILISDNILQEGDVMESRYAVERRDRTIHSRMREYLFALTNREGLSTVLLPLGDGVAVTAFEEGGKT